MRRLVSLAAIAFLACGEPVAPIEDGPADLPPVPSPVLVHVSTGLTCAFFGENPRFTFTASVTPDTVEVAYELTVEIPDVPDAVRTFVGTLLVDWGGPKEQRVEYRLEVLGHSFEGVSRCRVH